MNGGRRRRQRQRRDGEHHEPNPRQRLQRQPEPRHPQHLNPPFARYQKLGRPRPGTRAAAGWRTCILPRLRPQVKAFRSQKKPLLRCRTIASKYWARTAKSGPRSSSTRCSAAPARRRLRTNRRRGSAAACGRRLAPSQPPDEPADAYGRREDAECDPAPLRAARLLVVGRGRSGGCCGSCRATPVVVVATVVAAGGSATVDVWVWVWVWSCFCLRGRDGPRRNDGLRDRRRRRWCGRDGDGRGRF